jgi:F-type H+-transporting ATPase subunit alpha
MVEILKQDQYAPLPVEKQVVIIYTGVHGYLDDLPVELCRPFEKEFYPFLEERYPDILKSIAETEEITEATERELREAIELFKKEFKVRHGLVKEEPVEAEDVLARAGVEAEAAS